MKNPRGVYEKFSGSGIWWVRHFDAHGHLRREKAGSKSAATKLYAKRKTEANEGKKLPPLRRPTVTFGELAADAVNYIRTEYARPSDDVARMEVVRSWFASQAADAITPGLIRAKLAAAAREHKWSASTIGHYHNLICLAYRLGLENEKVKESPIHGKVRKPAENNSRVRFLVAEEEDKLRQKMRASPEWAWHEPEFDLALHTGLRRTSMYIDLIWENVDLAARTLTIPRTKNGDSITIPINRDAMRALLIFRARGDGKGRVVRNESGKTLNVNAHWFVPLVRAAGITNFRWHDLRHCYASRLRQAGVPLGNIAELLGHKGLAMSRRYAHLSISNLHEAVARIEKPTDTPTDTSTTETFAYLQ